MSRIHNQQGASVNIRAKEHGSAQLVIITIAIVVILGLLGFVGWKIISHKSDTKQTTSTTKTAKVSELMIHEWGLSATYNQDVLGTLTYTISGGSLTFSSPKVDALLPCAGISESSWGLTRVTADEMATMGADISMTPWTNIDDNFYRRTYPQAGCENKESEMSAIDKAYGDLFASLKAH